MYAIQTPTNLLGASFRVPFPRACAHPRVIFIVLADRHAALTATE